MLIFKTWTQSHTMPVHRHPHITAVMSLLCHRQHKSLMQSHQSRDVRENLHAEANSAEAAEYDRNTLWIREFPKSMHAAYTHSKYIM